MLTEAESPDSFPSTATGWLRQVVTTHLPRIAILTNGETRMAMIPHPVTRWPINEIELRHGPIQDKERDTARQLLSEGHARWVVAAMLGRFPLAFDGSGEKRTDSRKRVGGSLSAKDAARDPRQISMVEMWDDLITDLLGPETD